VSSQFDIRILNDRMPRVAAGIRAAGLKTLRDGGDRILRQAKRNIVAYDAIDTGNMLNSGYIRTRDYDGWPSTTLFPGLRLPAPRDEFEIQVNFAASYAIWVHEGTAFMQGRPFLQDAVDGIAPFIRQRFQQNLRGQGL
jgi:hypothetical protein